MPLKSVIRPFVPPVLYEAASRLKSSIGSGSSIRFQARPSFAAAALEAGKGYRDERLLSKFAGGPTDLRAMPDHMSPFLASVAIASMNVTERSSLTVLDFGGGSGHYLSYVTTAFAGRINAAWTVVETPDQVDHNAGASIEFTSSIPARQFDLAVFSGSLQYLDDWRAPLTVTDAKLLYIARTSLSDRERSFLQTVTMQGKALSYPGRVICRRELFDLMEQRYELFASWSFDVSLGELGRFATPAMLWKRR
jgi:putative methyltransferase (TIGR04325 family)